MKNLDNYISERLITEKLKLGKASGYTCSPTNKEELHNIIAKRLKENPDANLNDIDVSQIIHMSCLFGGLDPHNINISEWDVSNVEDMRSMFLDCYNFNSDLSAWDVSKVTTMEHMFAYCENFNSDLSKWDVSKVTNMDEMFAYCDNINADLSKWNVSNVKSWIGFAVAAPYNLEANYNLLPHWPKKKDPHKKRK